MIIVVMYRMNSISEIRKIIRILRRDGKRVGFVPTMGALHGGHLSLVRWAREECDIVVVSIFVNPSQFCPGEDYQSYPRPLEDDMRKCESAGVDVVFNPSVEEMYPVEQVTSVKVKGLTDNLCGLSRPGHFDGVTTVVTKLFNIVMPEIAYFGQKDAQQGLVLRRMVSDLNMNIEMRLCPTVREDNGLALSSRNQYLSGNEHAQAASLYQSLKQARAQIQAGEKKVSTIQSEIEKKLIAAGPCKIDYISIVDIDTIQGLDIIDRPVLIALAVKIGQARLIDNIIVDENGNEITLQELPCR